MNDKNSSYQREENRAKAIFEFDYFENRKEIQDILNCDQAYDDLNEIYNLVRSELKHGDEELSPNLENLLDRIKELAYRD